MGYSSLMACNLNCLSVKQLIRSNLCYHSVVGFWNRRDRQTEENFVFSEYSTSEIWICTWGAQLSGGTVTLYNTPEVHCKIHCTSK